MLKPCPLNFERKEGVNMARYTREQINSVAQMDMVDFLSFEYGYNFYKKGNGFSCEEHSSLFINSNKHLWFWNSRGIGGNGLFDWMSKVEGQDFKSVMAKYFGTEIAPAVIKNNEVRHYEQSEQAYFDEKQIPQKTENKYSNAFAYLTRSRCISGSIVSELMKTHRIYQDTRNNVVFVNPNEKGEVGFWCLRGTNTEKKFTRNMSGSNNPYYGFALDAQCECDILYVFEAPIDLLSHCTIADIKYGEGSWHNQHRIALCGVNDTALRYYLTSHKSITTIKFCLDNDSAGTTAANNLMTKYYELGYKIQLINYNNAPEKDLNEMLCNYINKAKQKDNAQVHRIEGEQKEKKTSDETAPEKKASDKKIAAVSSTHGSYNKDYMGLY